MYPISTGPDYSGLVSGIGQLIQGQIANSLQGKALQGDEGALARLASVSPQRYNAIGSILQDRRQQEMQAARQAEMERQRAEEENQRKREIAARFARGYQTANDKKGYLAAGVDQFRRFGLEDMAGMVEQDLSIYNENPAAVEQQYAGIISSYGDQGAQNTPVGIQEFDYLVKQAQSSDPLISQAAKIKLRTEAGATIDPEEYGRREAARLDAQMGRKASVAGEVEQAKADVQASTRPQIEAAIQAARDSVKMASEIKSEQRGAAKALEVYNSAMGNLVTAMGGTDTGPIAGRITAITPEAQIAEGAVATMAPVLKSIFRAAGEGVFTDRDQELLINMVPKRTDHPEAIKAKTIAIDAIVSAKLGGQTPNRFPEGEEKNNQTPPRRLKFNPATGRLE